MAAEFSTPKRKATSRLLAEFATPMKVPPSPMLKPLGFGTGVEVYRIERSPRIGQARSPWAIKRIRRGDHSDKDMFEGRLLAEAEILRKLDHPNIVGFRTMQITADGRQTLAMEDCNKSLGDLLEDREDNLKGPLPAADIIKMICDIVKGLYYLHDIMHLMHGDIKSFNVLVKGDFAICKLCDFGVSVPVDKDGFIDIEKNPNAGYVGTDTWSAPEVFLDNQVVSCKADIFSFGLTIYECLALIAPHTWIFNNTMLNESIDETVQKPDSSFDSDSELEEKMNELLGTRPPLPAQYEFNEEYNQVIELFFLCTNQDPEERPSAKVLKDIFDNEEKASDVK